MNKFKKITSAVVSAMTIFPLAVPLISTAEPDDVGLPYEVFEKAVMFFTNDTGSDNVDFIISGSPLFKTQRPDGNLLFQPIASGTYKISRTWLKEEIIPLANPYGHVHYFYPCIENYEVNYSTRNTTVEFLGARDYRNENTVKKYSEIAVEFSGARDYHNENTVKKCSEITDINDSFCFCDVTERNCDDILDDPTYYAFITEGSYYSHEFVYYDYGYNSVKDKSLFCLRNGYNLSGENVDLSGNIAVKDVIMGSSSTSYDLTAITGDEVPYMIIEPTAESGMGELFYEMDMDGSMPWVDFMMTIENGIFVNSWTMGCVLGDYGDLDMNDSLTVADIVTLNRYILGRTKLTNTQKSLADMNYDGIIDAFDLVLLKQKYFGNEPVIIMP